MLQQMAGRSLEEKLEALAAKPGNGYDEQTGLIFTEIPMERGESLHIDLELKEGTNGMRSGHGMYMTAVNMKLMIQ